MKKLFTVISLNKEEQLTADSDTANFAISVGSSLIFIHNDYGVAERTAMDMALKTPDKKIVILESIETKSSMVTITTEKL